MVRDQTSLDLNLVIWTKCYLIIQYILELDGGATQPPQLLILQAEEVYWHLEENPSALEDMQLLAEYLNGNFNTPGSP